MLTSKKSFALSIVATLSLVVLWPAAMRGEEKVRRVRLAYAGFDAGVTIALVGKEKGLFKRQGLDVEQIYIDDASAGSLQALIGVDIVLGSGNPVGPIQTILGGADIVFIGSHVNMERYRFGVSADIASIEQLKGKKIGVSGLGRKSDLIARVVLRRAGLDPTTDVEMVPMGYSPQRAMALSRNLIQGAPLVPEVAAEVEKLGLKVLNTREVPLITSFLITTRSFIKKNDEAVRRFVKGYSTAVHYYLAHRDESIGIMKKYVTADPAALETMYRGFAAQLGPLPAPEGEAVRAIIDAASVVDERAKTLKPEHLFDLRFIEELKASGFIENLYAEKINL